MGDYLMAPSWIFTNLLSQRENKSMIMTTTTECSLGIQMGPLICYNQLLGASPTVKSCCCKGETELNKFIIHAPA